ncbi:chemotaxis protein CheW [Teichococcus wenyumeiae]|nr:chemotaxis protein CheW [Pseudoroseomonas wenyumeiae]
MAAPPDETRDEPHGTAMASPRARPDAVTGGETHYLIFALAGLRCALPRGAVRELLPLPRLSRPPSMPATLAGFVNLGGEALPVLALRHLLGLTRTVPVEPLYRHIIVAEDTLPGSRVGLLVDRVLDLRPVAAAQCQPVPPEDSLNGCVIAQLSLPEGPAHLLDPARILLAQEQARLEELTRKAAARLDEWTA